MTLSSAKVIVKKVKLQKVKLRKHPRLTLILKGLTLFSATTQVLFKPVRRAHQGPRRGASPIRLRRREMRAAVREGIDIGDTTEEAVNDN